MRHLTHLAVRRVARATSLVALSLAGACRSAPSPAAPPAATAPAPAPAAGASRVTTSTETRRVLVDVRPGDLRPDTLSRLGTRVAALVAAPATLRVAVGDTVWLDAAVAIVAMDSAGRRLGRLPVYDFGMEPGAATVVHDGARGAGIVGREAGTSALRVRLPGFAWTGDPMARPGLEVPVVVGGA